MEVAAHWSSQRLHVSRNWCCKDFTYPAGRSFKQATWAQWQTYSFFLPKTVFSEKKKIKNLLCCPVVDGSLVASHMSLRNKTDFNVTLLMVLIAGKVDIIWNTCQVLGDALNILFLRVCVCSVSQWCPTLCDLMDCSPPGSSVHGIFQAKIVERGCCFLHKEIFPTQGSNLWLISPALADRFFTQQSPLILYIDP